jgi:hypothetical protein
MSGKALLQSKRNRLALAVIFCFCYITVAGLFAALRFYPLQSDAKGYWEDSLSLAAPFDPFHVPGYPIVIGLLRSVTVSLFPPVFYLQAVSFVSFSLALYLVFKIGLIYSGSETIGLISACTFMLWPMVGVTYVIYPVADALAMCLYLLGLYLLMTQRDLLSGLAWASTLFVHKGMWIFVLSSFILWAWQVRQTGVRRIFLQGVIVFGPLMAFAMAGSMHHHSSTWIVSSNLQVEVSSNREFLVLDGLVGTLRAGTLSSMIKGGILLLHFLVASYVVGHALKRSSRGWEMSLAIGLATLILIFVLNSYEIWASVRFGRLLAIPLATILGSQALTGSHKIGRLQKSVLAVLGLGLYSSQHFYAWYTVNYFDG